jgi:hypothetical protein
MVPKPRQPTPQSAAKSATGPTASSRRYPVQVRTTFIRLMRPAPPA